MVQTRSLPGPGASGIHCHAEPPDSGGASDRHWHPTRTVPGLTQGFNFRACVTVTVTADSESGLSLRGGVSSGCGPAAAAQRRPPQDTPGPAGPGPARAREAQPPSRPGLDPTPHSPKVLTTFCVMSKLWLVNTISK